VKRQPGALTSGSNQDPLSVASISPNDQLTRSRSPQARIHTTYEADLVQQNVRNAIDHCELIQLGSGAGIQPAIADEVDKCLIYAADVGTS
jgi:hypothetical protein